MKFLKWFKNPDQDQGPGGWWIMLIALLFTAACTGLAMITKNELYVNLSPYMAICFIAFGIECLIHTLINIGRLPGWGFNLLPALLCIFFGVMMMIFEAMEDRILAFYVGYGLLSAGLMLISYAFSIKQINGFYWIPVMIVGSVTEVPACMLLFYPIHQTFSILGWTQTGFVLLSVGTLVLAVVMFLQQRAIQKNSRRVAVRGRSFL